MRVVDNIDSVLVSCTQLLLNQVYKIINTQVSDLEFEAEFIALKRL